MEFKDWDEQMRDRLERLQPDYNPLSWDALEQRMDADARSEGDIDAELSERLRRIRPAYRPDSWPRLAALLDREAAIVQTLLNSKAAELTVAFLCFLLLWEGLPTPTPSGVPASNQISWESVESIDFDQGVSELPPPTVAPSAVFEKPNPERSGVASSPSDVRKRQTEVVPSLSNPTIQPLRPALPDLPSIRQPKPRAVPTPIATAQPTASVVRQLDSKESTTLAYTPTVTGIVLPKPAPRFRVGFIGTAWDFNLIRTSDVQIDESSKFISPLTDTIDASFISQGYSGGITFSADAGKVSYELGFIYTARPYKPVTIAFIAPDSNLDTVIADAYGEFEFNTVAIPFYVHSTLWRPNSKWRVYGTLGASLSVVTDANFYKASPESLDRPIRELLPRSGVGRSLEIKSSNLAEQAVSRPKGWFQGGQFFENATLYGLAGVGVERYLSREVSLFFQPTYQKTIPFFNKGLGPYGDRIDAFSMFLGMRYGL